MEDLEDWPCPLCGGPLPFAARKCMSCARESVANRMQWSAFLVQWRIIGMLVAGHSTPKLPRAKVI